MSNLFYPKVIFSCFNDKTDKYTQTSIQEYFSDSEISEYLHYYSSSEIERLNEFQISNIIRGQSGNKRITIPGDSTEKDVDYVVIIVGESTKINEKLEKIRNSTKFKSGQYPAYVFISEKLVRDNDFPLGLDGNILVTRETSTGRTINDEEYLQQVMQIAVGLIALNYPQIVDCIFRPNIAHTKVTVLARILQIPDANTREQINRSVLMALLDRLNIKSDSDIDIKIDFPETSLIKNIEEQKYSFEGILPPLRIPLFASVNKRKIRIRTYFDRYIKDRYERLDKFLNSLEKESQGNYPEDDLYRSIKVNFFKKPSFPSLLKNLKGLKSEIEDSTTNPQWGFLLKLVTRPVSGFPFNLSLLFIFCVLITLSILELLFDFVNINPILLLAVLIGYWPLLIISGIIYLQNKKRSIFKLLTHDFQRSYEVVKQNVLSNTLLRENVIKNVVKHKLDHYIWQFERNQNNLQEVIDQIQIPTENNIITIVNDWINANIDDLFEQIFQSHGEDIYTNLGNSSLLIDIFQNELLASSNYKQLIHSIAEKHLTDFERDLLIGENAPFYINQETSVNPESKQIIIHPVNSANFEMSNVEKVSSVVENLWIAIRVGVINEK